MNEKQKTAIAAPTDNQLSVFCYRLSLMQRAGIRPDEGIDLMLEDTVDSWEQTILQQAEEKLSEGDNLPAALSSTNVFPEYLIRMLDIAYDSGRMQEVLLSLSRHYLHRAEVHKALQRAITYPAFIAILTVLIFVILLTEVLPLFERVYIQLNVTASPLASALFTAGGIGKVISIIVTVILLLLALLILYLANTERGAKLSVRIASRQFGSSKLFTALYRSRFASSMALMLSSGLPIDECVEKCTRLLSGTTMQPNLQRLQEQLSDFGNFPKAVESLGLFDKLQCGLLSAGFRTGSVEAAMQELARRLEAEAEERLNHLLSRFESALIFILCLSVGFILISLMLPLLGVMTTIG